jgi:transposase-like protein
MRHSLDVIHCARQDYAEGHMPVEAICRKHGMNRHQLYYWLDGGPPGGEHHLPPIPRRGGVAQPRRRRRLSGDRVAIVRRMWRTAEAQVRDIEDRLRQDPQPPDERERNARVLAVLVKTLRDLSTLDESQADTAATTNMAGNDDEVPRDIDEFRRELARRMDAFVESRTGAGVSRD